MSEYSVQPDAPIEEMIERFHANGFLFIENVLPPDLIQRLKSDLEWALQNRPDGVIGPTLRTCMFEHSTANLGLFEQEPIVTFAEAAVDPHCHVIHNNSFVTPPGGGLVDWHQDDSPHYVVLEGEAPANVRLPPLWFTANYYLTDVTERVHGATEVIPKSHLFGKGCPSSMEGTQWESSIHPCLGEAGSVVLFNNQVWHRGGPNKSDRTRYITQVTYGRRLINSMFAPFMNYVMPQHVYRNASPRLSRLLGFLPHGTYG